MLFVQTEKMQSLKKLRSKAYEWIIINDWHENRNGISDE